MKKLLQAIQIYQVRWVMFLTFIIYHSTFIIGFTQVCKTTDFIYLNDPQDYNTQGFVHKLKIGTGGTLTEAPNGLGNTPWFPQGGGLGSPHGLGQDLNGNLYIGQRPEGPIAKIKCDGTLVSSSFINDGGFNIVSKDGYLYINSFGTNRISRYSLCDGSLQGYVTLDGVSPQLAWGLFISSNGTFYATLGVASDYTNTSGTKSIYRFNPTDADFTNHTNYTSLVSANNIPPGAAQANLAIPSAGAWLWGITADDAGNMYVVAEDPWFNHQDTDFTGYTWILKYDPAGNLIASTSQKQTTTPKTGFKGGRGIVYYAPLNILYIAAGPDGDCIAKINPSDLSYAGAAAANIPGQNPKTIRIATEACPVLASTSVDTTLCNVKVGDRLFLSQLIGKCNAPICGGTWAADPSNAGMTFNPCDLSFTVTGLTGCGKFTLTNVGGTCGDFTIEARISFVDIKAPVIAGTQTVCSNIDPAAFTVATPAASSGTLSYQWQKSTTSCTTGFSNILGANNDTYDPPKTTQTTYYRVVASSMGGCNPPPKTCSDTSNCVTVTVLPLPVAGDDQTPTCVGNIAITTATLAATAVSGGAWTQAPGNPPGATITTVSSATSGVTGLMPGVYQFIWATSASCSDTVKITIPNCACTKPLAKVNNQSLCEGDTPKAFTATPSTGVTYAWYGPLNDTTSTLGSAISGQTAATYTPNGTFAVGKIYYAVVVTDAADATCKDTAFAAITVLAKPAAIMFCPGESYTITAEPGTTNIKWYKDGLLIADSTRSSLVVKTIGSYTYSGIKPSGDLCPDTLCCPIVFLPCGSLGDYVWKDSNNDGIQNETGTGVKDVILELYKNGIATGIKDTTGIDGKYLFAISDSASYQVKIISALPTGCVISSMQNAAAGTEATDSDFNPSTGMSDAVTVNPLNPAKKDVLTVDAALYSPKGSIGDYVWKDADNDGVQDATEAPVAGVIVQLLQGTTVVATDTTDASGLYLFSNLSSDSYQVKILTASLPAGCVISTQKDLGGDDTKDSDIDPTTGLSLVIVIDALGTGIAKDNLTVDAALNSPKGSIGDYVWKDADNDGVQDATEAPVAGVIVQLLQGTTVVATDTTDASGLYLFSNLSSGSYQVKILTASLPAGCTISTQKDLGGDDTKDSDIDPTTGLSPVIVIDALGTGIAKDNMTVDAALYSPKGSIGDYVWKDADNDGVQDATEAPVAGVIVQLLQGTTVVATDTTDASGLYLFSNLSSGSYQVKILTASLPAGCTISTQKDLGGDDTKDSDIDPTTGLSPVIVIDALGTGIAKDNMTVDAALYSPKGSIGDYVWKDADNNGVQDATEAPVAGVIVQLLQGTTVVATDTTDASGLYLFSNLSSGSYQVKILTASLPAGCTISTQKDLGGDDTKDSDIDPTTGLSPVIVIDALGTGIAKDNLTVDAALYSPKGSIGDYVWKDADNDGVQDATEAPVAGVIVQLLQGTTVVATDTTDASGLYLFSNLSSGSYQVKILTASLPAGCTISTQKDLGGDDTKDSDFDPTTGLSPVIVIDALGTGIAKDNMTVDAALYSPCVKPDAGPDQTLVCATTAPSTANLVDAATGQKWKVLSVQPNTTVTVTTPAGDVMGMTAPGTYRFVLQTQSDSLACRDTVSIIVPDCSCPQVNILTPNATVCKDSLFPTLSIALLGSNTQGVSAAWYANATGGSSLGTGLSFKPAGTASVTDTFYVALTGASANCLALPRTPVIVTVQNCSVEIDLALKKSINIKIAQIGDELTYTIKVFNQLNVPATGVEVTDSIAATVQFVAGSFVASRGSATIVGNVIKWNIGGIAANAGANGDTVTLTYKVKATQEGVHFNTAEISKTNEKDVDSTPGDGKLGEDDIESQCFTVPFKLCPTEKVEVNVPAFLTNVQWFKDGGTAPIAAGSTVLLTELGTYTYTASNQICPANGCCPIIIEPGVNCCPEDLCIPFTIQKVKKK